MKSVFTILFLGAGYFSFAQAITIPANTSVPTEVSVSISAMKNKTGEAAKIIVSKDVLVDEVVVIKKGTAVHATITSSKKPSHRDGGGELRVDLLDVPAVDGTSVKLSDCWLFTTAAQNLNSKGALLAAGTKKNCLTLVSTPIKKGN